MNGTYNHPLVAISILVAIVASYTVLDLAARLRSLDAKDPKKIAWLLGGATAMGAGIWSMHFIGMLAMQMPIALGYDLWITAFSLLVAIALSCFALHIVSSKTLSRLRLGVAGVVMGLAIALMHYSGMAALRMHPAITYNAPLFCASIGIAIGASWAALWIASTLSGDSHLDGVLRRCGAASVMGLAIAGMHYTGIRAAVFSIHSVCGVSNTTNATWLAAVVASTTLILLISTVILSRVDNGLSRIGASLDEANRQLITLATRDSLTELPNRASLLLRMEEMIGVAENNGQSFTVMFTDLDGFKTINDSLGHAAGDDLLIKYSRHLSSCVRRGDMVSRLGGDEFVILLQDLATGAGLASIAQHILQRMQQDLVVGETRMCVTASIGLASYPRDGRLAEDLLRHADLAMYSAKEGGKNTFRFYNHEMSKAASRTLLIHGALSDALSNNQMSLHFQPKFNGFAGDLVGAEALIRWHHPEIGAIPPLEFIPIAERTGQIVELGNWVIREACKHIRKWDRMGLSFGQIAINISPEQLCLPGYIDTVLEITQGAGVRPDRLIFEITERAAMRDVVLSADVLRQFQSAGFDIAIDDFGTGYSSMAYLQQFRVKQLKIDRFFTNGIDKNGHEGLAIVSAIIAMAHSLDMVVVAEGVETITQLTSLKDLACDELQGFFLGKPQPAEAFEHLMMKLDISPGIIAAERRLLLQVS